MEKLNELQLSEVLRDMANSENSIVRMVCDAIANEPRDSWYFDCSDSDMDANIWHFYCKAGEAWIVEADEEPSGCEATTVDPTGEEYCGNEVSSGEADALRRLAWTFCEEAAPNDFTFYLC